MNGERPALHPVSQHTPCTTVLQGREEAGEERRASQSLRRGRGQPSLKQGQELKINATTWFLTTANYPLCILCRDLHTARQTGTDVSASVSTPQRCTPHCCLDGCKQTEPEAAKPGGGRREHKGARWRGNTRRVETRGRGHGWKPHDSQEAYQALFTSRN